MADPGEWQSLSDFIPMGLLYLAEACRARGHVPVVVQLLDAAATISRMEGGSIWSPERWKHFLARLLEDMTPQAVGIQCHWSYHSAGAFAVARGIREIDPSIHITIGGVHAGQLPAMIERQVPLYPPEHFAREVLDMVKPDRFWSPE